MTLVTATVEDIHGGPDNSVWIFSSLLRQSSDGDEIITPKYVKVLPVDGAISITLEPGFSAVSYRGKEYVIEVPPSGTADLWDLIAAAVVFPPGTPPELVGQAVLGYLATHLADSREVLDIPKSLKDFGAVADGTYNPTTHAVTGTDNTAAINAALAYGKPVLIPPGYFRYTGTLHTNVDGSGLVGSGKGVSFLISHANLDRHIAVVQGTQNTTWTDFSMFGPFTHDGADFNRALNIGTNNAITDVSDSVWDASGTWIDNVAFHGYCVGLHVALADNVQFGSIEVYEAGDSRAEPGAYGISCSGSNLYGNFLRANNTFTRGRHPVYYSGAANDCFVDVVEAKGWDLAAIQNRCTTGGGQRNGFGHGRFEDCATNSGIEPATSIRGVVNFVSADDEVVVGAGGARIGDYDAINCGGFPGPSLRYMPNSLCGTVQIYGHSGDFTAEHYGAQIYHSDNVRQPQLNFLSGFDAAGLNDATFRPMFVDSSSGCYGGGVKMHAGAVFLYGLNYNDSNYCTVSPGGVSLDGTYNYAINTAGACAGIHIPDLTLAGTYLNAVRWSGSTDLSAVDNVKPLTEPTAGLVIDASTGSRHSLVMRAPGYDMKEVSSGTTIDVTGYREIRLNYASTTTITALLGLQQSVSLKVTALNANARFSNRAGVVGQLEFCNDADRGMGSRFSFVVTGHVTGTTPSYTYRCLEASNGINSRIGTTASTATPSISCLSFGQYNITALAVDITGVTVTGTPSDNQPLRVRIKDDGTARAITWGAAFAGNLLPETVANRTYTQDLVWDAAQSKWVGTSLEDDAGSMYSNGVASANLTGTQVLSHKDLTDVTNTFPALAAPQTHAASTKATPVDADEFPLVDSAASNVLKKWLWSDVKAAIKSWYDSVSSTLTNKAINLANNTVTMTAAQLQVAVSDADVALTTGPFHPDQLASGFATVPRWAVNSSTTALPGTGNMQLTYFTADKTATVSGITIRSGGTAAAATPTLVRLGLFSVATNGDITLIASTANDTALFAALATNYTKSFSSSVGVTLGDRLAVGILVVSAAALPTMQGSGSAGSAELAIAPRVSGQVNSLSDLPSSTVAASIANNGSVIYARVA